ncbi:MAG: hypothetical protein M0008_12450, partial [Actinomycetota bacterium]|nr:hypothetical protein [Actinomycetota bacterium]
RSLTQRQEVAVLMLARQSETAARPEVHRPPKERATTARSPGTAHAGSGSKDACIAPQAQGKT